MARNKDLCICHFPRVWAYMQDKFLECIYWSKIPESVIFFFNLAVPGLSCSTQHLRCRVQDLSVAACGI